MVTIDLRPGARHAEHGGQKIGDGFFVALLLSYGPHKSLGKDRIGFFSLLQR